MSKLLGGLRALRLRNLVLLFLLSYTVLPLLVAALASARQNIRLVETQEQINLTHRVEALSKSLANEIGSARERLRELATTIAGVPAAEIGRAARQRWIEARLRSFAEGNPDLHFTRAVLIDDRREFGPEDVPAAVAGASAEAVRRALETGEGNLTFVTVGPGRMPAAALSEVGVDRGAAAPAVVLSAVKALDVMPEGQTMTLILDADGEILWAEDPDQAAQEALRSSDLVADFARRPSVFVSEYDLETTDRPQRMIAQVSPIGGVGWGLVVQQPKSAAFSSAREVVNSTLVSALLLVVLALVVAVGASQMVSRPMQRLAETSAEIAAGNFGGRVQEVGISREMTDLATNFNTMSRHVGESMERLRRAAAENHELFLGSIRALLAAIEAKEPYARGHSERVAAFSQAIARHMGRAAEFQEQIWVAGLLHDVGKLGIDDRILKKGNALTEEEYEEIKRHPIIGEEIMAPIEQLSYSLPAIRWHHEKWNGRGYPDGLRREAIPVMARIVSVADSFDAMTTQRVYQEAMSPQEAVAWIRSQNGVSFDAAVVDAFLSAYHKDEVRAAEPGGPGVQPVPVVAAAAVGDSVYT
ncbi:MAG: HD domain-containing protein [Thermoanaerobaculia bacterium]|nr:HD domain-containing protein [Thermoanaerobaculia bacterium]